MSSTISKDTDLARSIVYDGSLASGKRFTITPPGGAPMRFLSREDVESILRAQGLSIRGAADLISRVKRGS